MTEETPEPDTTELELRAQRAREQLLTSLARLDQRTKHIVHQATDASLASGLCAAGAVTFWLSISVIRRPRSRLQLRAHSARSEQGRPASLVSLALRTVVVAAGLFATGMFMQAAERRARNLAVGPVNPGRPRSAWSHVGQAS